MEYLLSIGLSDKTDISGVYGAIFHYSLVIAIVASTFLIFLYLWSKGRLDMDEEPKLQMMLNLESAVTNDKVMEDFDLELFPHERRHSREVKAPLIGNDSKSKDCFNLSVLTADCRLNEDKEDCHERKR